MKRLLALLFSAAMAFAATNDINHLPATTNPSTNTYGLVQDLALSTNQTEKALLSTFVRMGHRDMPVVHLGTGTNVTIDATSSALFDWFPNGTNISFSITNFAASMDALGLDVYCTNAST